MLKVKVLGASAYDFVPEGETRTLKGTNVWFLEPQSVDTDNAVGFLPKKVSMPYEFFHKLKGLSFPVECEATLTNEFTAKGIRTKISDFKPLGIVQK